MKKSFLLYIMILILSNCVLPVDENYDIVEETPVNIVTEDDETDDIITIQEVQTMELQPIKEYAKYVTSNGKVYGINGHNLGEVTLKDVDNNVMSLEKFFILDGMIYLSVSIIEMKVIPNSDPEESEPIETEYFFSQTGGQIQEELEIDFPTEPPSEHVTYNDSLFQIETSPYEIDGEMTDTSRVIRGGTPEAYLRIDGCSRVSGGFWFSVPESFATRLKGVYLWPEMGVKIRKLDSGRIW